MAYDCILTERFDAVAVITLNRPDKLNALSFPLVRELDEALTQYEADDDIKAVILTTDDRHQRMLIGQGARKVRNIGSAARKELEVAMNKKVFLDLAVLIDDEWMDRLS